MTSIWADIRHRTRHERRTLLAEAILCLLFTSIGAAQDASNTQGSAQPVQAAQPPPKSNTGDRRRAARGPCNRSRAGAGFASAGISASRGFTRSTNIGGGTGTSFASIPYEDTVQGNVSETRLSSQSSRLSLRVDADFPDPGTRFRRLSGYFEMDFVGATPGAVAVTRTSVGLRLRRQGFGEVQYGETWFLAVGQAFTLMTAQKAQLSMPRPENVSEFLNSGH